MKKNQLDKINDLRCRIKMFEKFLKSGSKSIGLSRVIGGTLNITHVEIGVIKPALTAYRDQLKAELAGLGYEGE